MKTWLKYGLISSVIFTILNIIVFIMLHIFAYLNYTIRDMNPILSGIWIITSTIINIVPFLIIRLLGLGLIFYDGMFLFIFPKTLGIITTALFWFGVGVLIGWIIEKRKSIKREAIK